MDKNFELLKKSLIHNNPNLFIGAGFSLGAHRQNGNAMPKGNDLGKNILIELLKYDIESEEFKQLTNYPLPKICTYAVNKIGKESVYNYLQAVFQNVKPAPFHYSFAKYPWDKIFSTNIDDVIERVFEKSKQNIIVQNSKHCSVDVKRREPELFKLHGCVNNLEEGLIFDEEEYINSLLDIQDYRFGVLSVEIQNKDFIFIGSNYDDFNIKYYLNLYASTTFTSARGKLFFVNPFPNLMFESEIEKAGGILLKCNTEEFAQLLEETIISKESINEVKLEIDGYINLKRKKDEAITNDGSKYNSNLFIGSHPNWTDIFYDWDIRILDIEKEFLDRMNEFEGNRESSMIYAFVGKGYSGKSVILKRLSNILLENDYDVVSFEGRSFNPNRFISYVNESSFNKYALVVDDGSYLYNQMEYIQRVIRKDIKMIILTTSRPYFHSKRKYSLIDCYYYECMLNISITESLSETIYNKIDEKGYLGVLSKIADKKERLSFIKSAKDIASVMFEVTNGKNFKRRFKQDTDEIIKTGTFREALIKLAIFDKLELPHFPKDLLVNIYKNTTVGIIKRIDDVIRKDNDKTRFNLKNYYITEVVLHEANQKEILNNLKELLIHVSPYVENTTSSYWNEMQSVLMRDKLVKDRLKIKQTEMKNMLYEIRSYYSDNYNYWLQLGIAEQLDGDYEKALNHFTQAEALGPNSYMVKNAIGKNFILQAINEDAIDLSKELFNKGKETLLLLIETKEEFQVKAYSIHTYVTGLINFYSKKKTLKISKKEIKEAQEFIDRMLNKDKEDPLFNSINKQFNSFLVKSNTGTVKLNFEKLQLIHDAEDLADDLW